MEPQVTDLWDILIDDETTLERKWTRVLELYNEGQLNSALVPVVTEEDMSSLKLGSYFELAKLYISHLDTVGVKEELFDFLDFFTERLEYALFGILELHFGLGYEYISGVLRTENRSACYVLELLNAVVLVCEPEFYPRVAIIVTRLIRDKLVGHFELLIAPNVSKFHKCLIYVTNDEHNIRCGYPFLPGNNVVVLILAILCSYEYSKERLRYVLDVYKRFYVTREQIYNAYFLCVTEYFAPRYMMAPILAVIRDVYGDTEGLDWSKLSEGAISGASLMDNV